AKLNALTPLFARFTRFALPALPAMSAPRPAPRATADLRSAGEERLLRLVPDELATLRIGTAGDLAVLRGRAWVTIDGEPADHFVGRGESLALRPGSVVRIGGDADGTTLLRIATTAPASAGNAGPAARAALWLRERVHRGNS